MENWVRNKEDGDIKSRRKEKKKGRFGLRVKVITFK